MHVFHATDFGGTPVETVEAAPLWFTLADVPYHDMWEDDRYWLPLVIQRRKFAGRWVFEGDRMLDYELDVCPLVGLG